MARLTTLSIFLGILLSAVSPSLGQTQEKCGVVAYQEMLQAKNPSLETDQQFEQWMQQKLSIRKFRSNQVNQIQSLTYIIPVVVHIIHNGEAIGSGTNISDAQIQSQIKVLNDDYNRINADASNTMAEFLPVAGSISLQFVLAKQDPEGVATTGITRTKGTKTSWAITDNTEFKGLNYWPAENYLNIWVINMSGNLLGFAQLPESTQLPGLELASSNRLTDGVAVHYRAFGTIDGGTFNLISQYNKGRTTTHEVGHFLGLRHIWGDDGNCNTTTDYVADTPSQNASTSTFNGVCPVIGASPLQSCGHDKMYQNYMDYTDDGCMNLFTKDQVARMVVILANSPRRLSLLTSAGQNPPAPVANDLGIRKILSPQPTSCNTLVTPQVLVRNYGSNQINSATVQLSLNSAVIETKTFSGLVLDTLKTATFSFNSLSFAPSSSQQVSFQILATNGGADGLSSNNTASVQVQVPLSVPLPINEPFNSLPTGWLIINPDLGITWANGLAPDSSPTNRAMYMNFHAYENQGELDWMVTPSFATATPSTSQLRFDVAYAQYPGQTGDGLKVYALPGCSTDLSTAILLYDKSDASLATTSATSNSFAPSSDAQWRKSEVISLNTLTNTTNWQLAFVARNGFGNNLFIDNININDKVVNDIGLAGIVSPSLVHCVAAPAVQFNVRNLSSFTLTSFDVVRTLNGGSPVTQTFATSLIVGEQKTFTLNTMTLQTGLNEVTITITNPNAATDANPANNSITFNTYLDATADASPLRQTFDSNLEISWLLATPFAATGWSNVLTNKNRSVVYKAFNNTTPGEESWVVSPVLDLSRRTKGSLLFDVSYAQRLPANDQLRVVASDDCGLTYKTVLYDHNGSEFSTVNSATEWFPSSASDWKQQYVNLDALAGKKNIRLALIATNANGNNLYLDNLEFFAGDDSDPPVTPLSYQLYYTNRVSQSDVALTFNLSEKKDVRLQIFSLMGQVVADNVLPETLNQTYYFDLSVQSPGLYIFRLQIDDQYSATKVYIGH